MEDLSFKIGDILQDRSEGTMYRVIAIVKESVTLCIMEVKNFQLISFGLKSILLLLTSGDLTKREEEPLVVDIDTLSDDIRTDYENKLSMMREVEQMFGPDFMGLCGHRKKSGLKSLMNEHNVTSPVFWKLCRRYFQSGRNANSLIDARALSPNKGCKYNYTKKPGKKPSIFPDQGVIITQEVLDNFEEARQYYLTDAASYTWETAYNFLITQHYYSNGSEDGTQPVGPYPLSETPTRDQFYYYMRNHLSHAEVRAAKTSSREANNNERLLLGDPTQDTAGCGDCVEIDACEFDVCLVSSTDKGQSVSHPTVYIALDQYSRAIVGCAIGYEQNSVMGITNLLLNLADDKKEYCKKYGIGFKDPLLWPSNFLPARIRMDRGSEMKSKKLEQICLELGIQKDLVPPGSGSYKGYVESIFRQMQADLRAHLAKKGGVDHQYGSNPHKEAQLDIWDYTKLVIVFILYYNNHYMENYNLTKEMLDDDVVPRPKDLWEYGCKKYGDPKPISDPEQYQFTLMTSIKPKYNRRGINYKGLWYVPTDDAKLLSDMMKAQNRKQPLEGVRMDMRCVDAVYYVRDGKLMKAILKPAYQSFAKCTMQQWEADRKKKSVMDILGRIDNERQDVDAFIVYENLVDAALSDVPVSDTDIRGAREEERQSVNAALKMEDRPIGVVEQDKLIEAAPPDDIPVVLPESVPEQDDDVDSVIDAGGMDVIDNAADFDDADNVYDDDGVDDGADEEWLDAVERAIQAELTKDTVKQSDS